MAIETPTILDPYRLAGAYFGELFRLDLVFNGLGGAEEEPDESVAEASENHC